MKQFTAIIFALIVSANAANPGYRYQQPPRAQPQPIRPALPPQSNSGIFSAVQSPPLPPPQFSPPPPQAAPPAISLPAPPPPAPPLSLPAPHEIAVPAPAPIPVQLPLPAPAPVLAPQQQYLPPQQHQQQQSFVHQHQHQQQQQVQFQQQAQHFQQQQPQQNVQAIPSIPQGHQQQVVQQQLSQPIQSNGFQQQSFQSFQRPQTAIITKDIFIHSAPEDNGSDGDLGPQLDNGPVRKNYRIVFIKAPSQNLRGAAAALKRAQAQNEEKTIIYVLSKKPDLSEVSQQLQQVQGEQKVNKPEVYFIKYKTQEEAQRAQQEIQAQYDALGGSTHISDEGIAPVTSIGGGVSSGALNLSGPIGGGVGVGASYSQGGIQQQSFVQQSYQSQSGAGISQKYLPSKAFKK